MSVLDSIDTTVTIAWGDTRTIGTLIELGGRLAILTALRTPEENGDIHIVVEGDTPDENVAIDGTCTSVSETAWGEQQVEVDLHRVGTTCSASRLRDFIEQYGILRGGSVHIGKNRDNPNSKRFVYHLPESRQGIAVSTGTATSTGRQRRPTMPAVVDEPLPSAGPRADLPSPRHMPSFEVTAYLGSNPAHDIRQARAAAAAQQEAARDEWGSTAPPDRELGMEWGTDTLPEAEGLARRGSSQRRPSGGFELGADQATHPDFVLPSSLYLDSAGPAGDGLDAGLQEALLALEQPRTPGKAAAGPTAAPSARSERVPPDRVVTSAFDEIEPADEAPTSAFDAVEVSLSGPHAAFDVLEDSISAPRGADRVGSSDRDAAFKALESSLSTPSVAFETREGAPASARRRDRAFGGFQDTPEPTGPGISPFAASSAPLDDSFLPSAAFEAVDVSDGGPGRRGAAAISELSSVFDAVEAELSSDAASDDRPWYAALGDAGEAWAEESGEGPIEVGSAVALEEVEPTRMMRAVDDPPPDVKETANYTGFDADLRDADPYGSEEVEPPQEVQREHISQELLAKIDDAIALERAFTDSEHYDPDEPIIVNTVAHNLPFADPVQLGHDNLAPSIADVRTSFKKAKTAEPKPKRPVSSDGPRARPKTADHVRVGLSIKRPETPPEESAPPTPATPPQRDLSEALQKVEQVFGIDLAVRCDLPVLFGSGRKKRQGNLLRMAESRLRIESDHQPALYERLDVVIPVGEGGKTKVTLNCEVTRIREPQEEGAPIAFDMRLASSNPPKQMNALRDLIRSLEGDAA